MLALFDTTTPIPFFPTRWANAVTQWLTGLCSPSGTIKIQNTSQPDYGGGCRIDVDVEVLYQALRERMKIDFVARDGFTEELRKSAGQSLNVTCERLEVSDGYFLDRQRYNENTP